MIYVFVVLGLFWFIYIYDYKGCRKDKLLWYNIMMIIFVVIAGFRYRLGIDTVNYEDEFYRETLYFSEWNLSNIFLEADTDSGYLMYTSLMKSLFGSWEVAQFLIALFVNVVVFRFLYKNTIYPFVAILLYFCSLYYDLNFETLRQALALSFFLLGYKYLMENKYLKYYIFVILSILFHKVALLTLFFPFIKTLKVNVCTVVSLIFSFFFIEIINDSFPEVAMLFSFLKMDLVEEKILGYAGSEIFGGFVDRSVLNFINIFIVSIFPYLVFVCIDKRYNLEISSKNDFLLFLYLLGVVLTTSVPIFYRLSQFFLIFPIVYMTNAFSSFFRIKSQGLKCLMLICCIFFLYAHVGRFFRLSPDSGERLLVRVYPYSNVFTKEKDTEREKVYNFYFSR